MRQPRSARPRLEAPPVPVDEPLFIVLPDELPVEPVPIELLPDELPVAPLFIESDDEPVEPVPPELELPVELLLDEPDESVLLEPVEPGDVVVLPGLPVLPELLESGAVVDDPLLELPDVLPGVRPVRVSCDCVVPGVCVVALPGPLSALPVPVPVPPAPPACA